MSGIIPQPGPTISDVRTALIATDAPLGEATTAAPGDPTKAQSMNHQHPRLTSTTYATIATGSTVQVNFTRAFVNKPGIDCTEIEGDTSASAQPAIFKVQSWIQDTDSTYIGAVIKVWRGQVVPQNLVSLLVGAVFNLFGASVVGTQFCCIAIKRSDVA